MPTLKNINPVGAVDLPLIGQTLDRDATFDVTDEQAELLLQQVDNYELVGAKPKKSTASTDATTTTPQEG